MGKVSTGSKDEQQFPCEGRKLFRLLGEMDFNSLWDENIISEDDDGDLPRRILLKTIIIIIIFSLLVRFQLAKVFPAKRKVLFHLLEEKVLLLFLLDSFTKIKNKEHKLLDKLWNYDFILVLSASSLCPANAFSL